MTIGALYYHVVVFWVTDDGYPSLNFASSYDSDTAYDTAAFGIKGKTPKGFVIAEREGDRFQILESYFPPGGPERFTVRMDSINIPNLYFDGVQLS